MLMTNKEMKFNFFILSGLNYLHHRHVVHRDIKCANILVDVSGSVKLPDYGLAEVINYRRDKGYGVAADIWSLGCTVLEMLTCKTPYSNMEAVCITFTILLG
ncbi:putative mitogen-activated protein kinase kinase kinase WNK-NRBP family [Helianthus anomalus]